MKLKILVSVDMERDSPPPARYARDKLLHNLKRVLLPASLYKNKEEHHKGVLLCFGGSGGIRTHGTVRYN